jgi:hypothetical protein
MNRCESHDNIIDTHQMAHIAARAILRIGSPELTAEFMTALGTNICCGAVGYAQYLMANAMREALLPNGADHDDI